MKMQVHDAKIAYETVMSKVTGKHQSASNKKYQSEEKSGL